MSPTAYEVVLAYLIECGPMTQAEIMARSRRQVWHGLTKALATGEVESFYTSYEVYYWFRGKHG